MTKSKGFQVFMYVLVGGAGVCRLRLTEKDRQTVARDYQQVDENGPVAHAPVDLLCPDAPHDVGRYIRHIFSIRPLKFTVNFLLSSAFEMGREYERREARKRKH